LAWKELNTGSRNTESMNLQNCNSGQLYHACPRSNEMFFQPPLMFPQNLQDRAIAGRPI